MYICDDHSCMAPMHTFPLIGILATSGAMKEVRGKTHRDTLAPIGQHAWSLWLHLNKFCKDSNYFCQLSK